VSIKIEVLRRYIRELIKQEIDEASVTGAIDGGEGPPKTPAAFRKKNSKKIKKAGHEEGHKDPAIFGYKKVSEAIFHVRTEVGSVIVDAGGKGEAVMKVAKALKKGRKGIISVNRVGVSKAKQVDKKLENVNEADEVTLKKKMAKEMDMVDKHRDSVKKHSGVDKDKADRALARMKAAQARADKIQDKIIGIKKESVTEGKYHDYKNDESLTAKQKIGYSMREVRDKLTELDKLVKMNVRLKNEIGVDSTSYWKRTHTAMKKISERLVKLANKVGQLY
jgi:hypothetical protein